MNPAHWNRCKQGLHTHTHIQYVHTHTHTHTARFYKERAPQTFMDTWRIMFYFWTATYDYSQENLMIYFPFIYKIIANN